ncbi:hypothetical protein LCGC14_2726210, partial [marine sediment metagenome]
DPAYPNRLGDQSTFFFGWQPQIVADERVDVKSLGIVIHL